MGTLSCSLAVVALALVVADVLLESTVGEGRRHGFLAILLWTALWGVAVAGVIAGLAGIRRRRLGRLKATAGLLSNVTIVTVFAFYLWWPTPGTLVQAAANGNMNAIERSLSMGVDVNTATVLYDPNRSITPLIAAVEHGQPQIIELLLSRGGDVMQPDSQGTTALYQAVVQGQLNTVILLLEHGANPNVGGLDQNCLHHAAKMGDVEIARQLLEHGADPNDDQAPPLTIAAESGQTRVVQLLIKHEADVNAQDPQGNTALHYAAANGHLFTVQTLLRYGADPNRQNTDGETPLDQAIQEVHPNITSALLEKGARLDVFMAIGLGDLDRVRQIILADPSLIQAVKRNRTPLHEAARWGLTGITTLLLRSGAQIDARTPSDTGLTALHWAVVGNHPAVAELLLENGADPNLTLQHDEARAPALYFAAVNGYTAMAEKLLEYGADVNAHCDTPHADGTPLFFAVTRGHIATAEMLLNFNADVNGRFNDRSPTPLYEAIRRADPEMVSLLVHHGADLQRNVLGFTPLGYASSRQEQDPWNYQHIMHLLREKGAKN